MSQVCLYAERSLDETAYAPSHQPAVARGPRPTLRERLTAARFWSKRQPIHGLNDRLLHDIGMSRADVVP